MLRCVLPIDLGLCFSTPPNSLGCIAPPPYSIKDILLPDDSDHRAPPLWSLSPLTWVCLGVTFLCSHHMSRHSLRCNVIHTASLLCPFIPTLHCEEQFPLQSLCPLPEPSFLDFRNVQTQQAQGGTLFSSLFPPRNDNLLLLCLYLNSLLIYIYIYDCLQVTEKNKIPQNLALSWPGLRECRWLRMLQGRPG